MSGAHAAFLLRTFESWLDRTPVLATLRHAWLVAILLAVWLTLAPFTSLRPDGFEATGAGPINYIVFGLMAAAALPLIAGRHAALASLPTGAMIALWVWLLINGFVSTSPSVSITRLSLVAIAFVLAACVPLLAQSERGFTHCLAVAGGVLLSLCYIGVLFLPELSIHSAYDIVEPHLAGAWRGTFAHKNSAAPVMAMLVFVGLHLMRSGLALGGAMMVAGAGVFLLFCGGKTAMALCLYTLLASLALARARSLRAMAAATFGSLALLNVTSVGSVLVPALDALLDYLPIDSSFTGRAEIWTFALQAIRARPILGYGFAAFWGEPVSANMQLDDGSIWTVEASHSHNGYLDLILTIGLPGLLLSLAVFVYIPLRNYVAARRLHPNDSLALLFMQIWFFGVHLASMESVFLYRIDSGWFTFLLAVFGLHYFARFPAAQDRTPPGRR